MQPTQPAEPIQPSQTPQQPLSQQPAANGPTISAQPPVGGAFSTKILEPKTLGLIFLGALAYGSTAIHAIAFGGVLIWIAFFIYNFIYTSKLKTGAVANRTLITLLLAFNPIVAQAVFYYRIKKNNEPLAKSINRFGWKIFGLEVVLMLAIGITFVSLGLDPATHK